MTAPRLRRTDHDAILAAYLRGDAIPLIIERFGCGHNLPLRIAKARGVAHMRTPGPHASYSMRPRIPTTNVHTAGNRAAVSEARRSAALITLPTVRFMGAEQ